MMEFKKGKVSLQMLLGKERTSANPVCKVQGAWDSGKQGERTYRMLREGDRWLDHICPFLNSKREKPPSLLQEALGSRKRSTDKE